MLPEQVLPPKKIKVDEIQGTTNLTAISLSLVSLSRSISPQN